MEGERGERGEKKRIFLKYAVNCENYIKRLVPEFKMSGTVLIGENRSAKNTVPSTAIFSIINPIWTVQALNPEVTAKDFTECSLFYVELKETSRES
jgi:hypothetical protein